MQAKNWGKDDADLKTWVVNEKIRATLDESMRRSSSEPQTNVAKQICVPGSYHELNEIGLPHVSIDEKSDVILNT